MQFLDHGGDDTWSMVHNLPTFWDFIRENDPSRDLQHQNFCITLFGILMTPQGESIIQNVVHFGQKSGKIELEFGQDFNEK